MNCANSDSSNRKAKIATLTDHEFTPSSRFRLRQLNRSKKHEFTDFPRKFSSESAAHYFPNARISENIGKAVAAFGYENLNIIQTFARMYATSRFDLRILSRHVIVGYPSWEKLLRRPFIYDVDDAIWIGGRTTYWQTEYLARKAELVVCGNEYLSRFYSKINRNTVVFPTPVDTQLFNVSRSSDTNANKTPTFSVGWSGTSGGFCYLEPIATALAPFFNQVREAEFIIVSDRFPTEIAKIINNVKYIKWQPENEVSSIQKFSVGLMPMLDSEWARGKCAYKMLLYLSCGIPCLVTPIGVNAEVLALGKVGFGCGTDREWLDHLFDIYRNREYLPERFPDCRSVVEKYFSLESFVTGYDDIVDKIL